VLHIEVGAHGLTSADEATDSDVQGRLSPPLAEISRHPKSWSTRVPTLTALISHGAKLSGTELSPTG
jgi:hypothetical protein